MEYVELNVLRKFTFDIVASLLYEIPDKHSEKFYSYYYGLSSSC